jgi:hypothetical protein
VKAATGRRICALFLALTAAGVAAQSASTALPPPSLYRALLTRSFSGLPSGYYSAKVGVDSLSDKDKRHHAVGAVLVAIDSGDAGAD